MKKLMLSLVLLSVFFSPVFAKSVSGYTKANGTHVEAYQRTNANSTQRDNYSTKGNVNPYTGVKGTKNAYK